MGFTVLASCRSRAAPWQRRAERGEATHGRTALVNTQLPALLLWGTLELSEYMSALNAYSGCLG